MEANYVLEDLQLPYSQKKFLRQCVVFFST